MKGQSQKKDVSPVIAPNYKEKLKYVKNVFCVDPLSFASTVPTAKHVVQNLPVGARLQNFWQTWLDLGASPKVIQILREGYPLPFRTRPKLTHFPTVVSCYVNPQQEQLPVGGITSAYRQERSGTGTKSKISGLFNRLFLVPKPNNKWRPILDPISISLPQGGEIQNGDTRNHQDFPPTRGVGDLNRLQGRLFSYPHTGTVQEISEISCRGATYQFKALPFGLSTALMEFTVIAKEVKLMAIHKGIRIHQYLDNWLVRARSHQICLQHTQTLVKMCKDLGWLVNVEKSELEPKQDRWQNLQEKILSLLSLPSCPVRQFMSLIGLITTTEKQVHLGQLHMRPIQWHLKNNWRVPELLEKVIPLPRSLHPHLQWWLEESNVLQGQPLHPIKHALQIFTDTSKEGWGTHLNEHTARGSWSLPEGKLHINYLELKAVFLALKEFQDLCSNQIVLVATDNTTVVSYINKEGGMRSGPLCALLWRILTWCTSKQVTLKA